MIVRTSLICAVALLSASCSPPPSMSSEPSEPGTTALAQAGGGVDDGQKGAKAPAKKAPKLSADELQEKALRAAQSGNFDDSLALLDEALAIEPGHRKALVLKAMIFYSQASEQEPPKNTGLYLKAAEALRKIRDAHKTLETDEGQMIAQVLEKLAGAYAAEGKEEKAFAALDEATDVGILGDEQLEEDKALAPLRKSPKFAEFLKRAQVKAKAHARKQVKELLAENKPFEFDFKLPDLKGKPVALRDVRGKVTIIDVWGTWCPPCRKEIPHFVELYKDYHDKGLEIVGLNYENGTEKESRESIKEFVDEHKIPYPCLIGDEKTQARIPDFEGYPTTLFLDAKGDVRLRTVGYRPKVILEAAIQCLLDEASGSGAAR